METINVLVTMSFPDPLIEKLATVSPRLNIVRHEAHSPDDLPENVAEFEVIYTLFALPSPDEAPDLRWVQLHSAGVNHVLSYPIYTDTDVILTTTSGIHSVSIAEYTMAQVLAFAHRLPHMFEDKTAGVWTKGRWERYVPAELRGATLGIVGYGSIGREVARLAQAFGMTVLATKRNIRKLEDDTFHLPDTGDPEADIPDRLYPIEALHSLLSECDYVVVSAPLTEATHHLIDAAALAHMKPSAVLVNVARGDLVDENALIEALQEGTIAGAGLDVFHEEPLPEDSPLWALPNVIISPHVSGFSPLYDDRATDVFAENLRRYIVGEPLVNVVERERGY